MIENEGAQIFERRCLNVRFGSEPQTGIVMPPAGQTKDSIEVPIDIKILVQQHNSDQ
jgi:hypothetical protein